MPVPNPNSLQRMTITAVNDDANRAEKSDGRFEVMFNPNSYSISYRNQLERHNTRQPQLPKVESRGTDNQTFQVTLIIDGTGLTDVDGQSVGSADKAGEGTWVKQKLQRFLRICQETQEDPHSPNLLHVQWGIIDFYGRLQSVQINFTLFAPNGNPLRAELQTEFVLVGDNIVRLSSPDLTHTRFVKAGDTLPLLAKDVYGSSRYYLWVAETNGLDDFRNLKPGTRLYFPPLNTQNRL